jgi:uncharacterized protein (TIGR03437 family)
VCLKTQRLVRNLFLTLTLMAAAVLLTAGAAAAQPRPQRTSRFPLTGANQAVIGGEWDYFIAGDHLNFRSGAAKMTEPFHSLTLPAAGAKIAADSQNVYVWLDEKHLVSYAIGDQGPSGKGVQRSGDDSMATEALRRPYVSPSRNRALALPAQIQTITPQRLFVANSGNDSVTAIDTSTNATIGSPIALLPGANPQDIQVSPSNYIAYTANGGGGAACGGTCINMGAQSFDPMALTTAGNILPAQIPSALAFTPDGTAIFVADDLFVRAYNASTGASLGTVQASASALGLAVSPDGTTLYTVENDDYYYVNYNYEPVNAVSVISTASPGSATHYRVPAGLQNSGDGLGCYAAAVSPVNNYLYLACNWELYGSSATPAIYQLSFSGGNMTILNTFFVPGGSFSLVFSPDGSKLYVSQYGANSVLVMDPSAGTQLATIPVGSYPEGMAINSSGTRAYTANYKSNTVSVIDLTANTVTATTTVGTGPTAVSLSYAPPGAAVGNVGGIVNAASFAASAPVSAGSLVSLFGTNIGPSAAAAAGAIPLPTTLSSYQVTMGGKIAPLLFAASGQINAQVPFEVAGLTSVPVVVSNGSTSSAAATLNLSSSAPGIFTVGGTTQGVIVKADNSLIGASNPAHPGDTVVIYATGQGAVTNAPASGAAAQNPPLSLTPTQPIVLIGNLTGAVQFSGLTPGLVGLWQINVTIPSNVTPGSAVPVQVVMNGAISNGVTLTIASSEAQP